MNSTGRSNLFRFFTASGMALLMVSCSGLLSHKAKPPGEISKVKYELVDPLVPPKPTIELAIPFETQYHLYGAITQKDMRERSGHYYTIFWSVADRDRKS